MPEYIEREAVLCVINGVADGLPMDANDREQVLYDVVKQVLRDTAQVLQLLPVVEASSQVSGEWLETGESPDEGNNWDYVCSRCGHRDTHAKSAKVNYCWFCGARMS